MWIRLVLVRRTNCWQCIPVDWYFPVQSIIYIDRAIDTSKPKPSCNTCKAGVFSIHNWPKGSYKSGDGLLSPYCNSLWRWECGWWWGGGAGVWPDLLSEFGPIRVRRERISWLNWHRLISRSDIPDPRSDTHLFITGYVIDFSYALAANCFLSNCSLRSLQLPMEIITFPSISLQFVSH